MGRIDKVQIAYDYIKEKIINGDLKPLDDISESKIQNELKISRTPVREALKKLKEEWFVIIYPRKGTIVTEITFEFINSIYEIRLLSEPYIYEKVCGKVSEEWLNKLEKKFLNVPKDLSDEEIRFHYINLDSELHSTLLDYYNNIFLKNTLKIVYDHNQRIRVQTSLANQTYENSIKEHLQIIKALKEHNFKKVKEMTITHLKKSRNDAFKYLTHK